MRVEPFGDEALRFALPDVDRHVLEAALRRVDGVTDVVFGEHVGMVVGTPSAADVGAALARPIGPAASSTAPEIVLPTCYDGPDLGRVAEWAGLNIDTVVERHAAPTYSVKFLGFLPGFAYMGDVDPSIAAPRLPSPRPRIPPGAVAVAGARTGVYPFASPGGWNLLGRVGMDLFDLDRGARLHAGDRVRFAPVDRVTERNLPPDAPSSRSPVHVDILDVVGPAWIQDGGRPGRRGDGVPPGGALVPELLSAANCAAGNSAFAPALELFGSVTLAARGGDLWIGWAGEPVRLARDHIRRFDACGLGYLAVAGGFDTPMFLGGRGALPVIGVPPLRGPIGLLHDPAQPVAGGPALPSLDAPIRVSPGPEPAGLDALLAAAWRIGPHDRTGMRLLGPPLPSIPDGRLPSAPMIRGAIQLPPGGAPVVLGPDHPTTGGYPVVAVVRLADQGALAARPLGAPVRFVL